MWTYGSSGVIMTKEDLWKLLSIQREKFEWYKFYCCMCGELIKENDYYVIHGKQVEKMFKMTNFQSDEGIERFIRQLRKLGIDEELEKMNIEDGSIVKILDYEFEYHK